MNRSPTRVAVGEIWESLDPREHKRQIKIVAVNQKIDTFEAEVIMPERLSKRRTTLCISKFLKRVDTRSGFKRVEP